VMRHMYRRKEGGCCKRAAGKAVIYNDKNYVLIIII
jgi:hypothetical protein